jgi:hypothetical protein
MRARKKKKKHNSRVRTTGGGTVSFNIIYLFLPVITASWLAVGWWAILMNSFKKPWEREITYLKAER